MYRDLRNLTIIKYENSDAHQFITQDISKLNKLKYDEIKVIGFKNLDKKSGVPLEMQFYQLAGIPFNKKWDSFFIKRDHEIEDKLFKKIAPRGDYAFIHEDASRGFGINKDLIDKNCALLIAENSFTDNIIDYCTVIEKAKEIHVIDSSFMFLIDFLPYNNPDQKLFVHRYARENHEWLLPVLKKDWNIIIDRDNKKRTAKEILRILLGNKNTLLRKIVRRIFRKMKWDMVRPKHPDLKALIRRYVYGKSFLAITPEDKKDAYLSVARTSGAAISNWGTAKEEIPADTVFYSGEFSQTKDQKELLKKLYSLTKINIIFHTKNCVPEYIESMLIQVGFETREKHLFPSEACFICRVVSKNKNQLELP
jgi:hypothetical protein